MHFLGQGFPFDEGVVEVVDRQNRDVPVEHRFCRKPKEIGERRFARSLGAVDAEQQLGLAVADLRQPLCERQIVLFRNTPELGVQPMSGQKIGHFLARELRGVLCHVCFRRYELVCIATAAPDSMTAANRQITLQSLLLAAKRIGKPPWLYLTNITILRARLPGR